jgi:hypothetical protein
MTTTLKKKRAPKKYLTEESILKDIDLAHRKIQKLEKFAQTNLDLEELLRGSNVSDARKHQEEADGLLGRIKRLRETRLVRLGKTLAMFRTKPLVAMSRWCCSTNDRNDMSDIMKELMATDAKAMMDWLDKNV